jgi:hypothetical protein
MSLLNDETLRIKADEYEELVSGGFDGDDEEDDDGPLL